MHSPTSPRSLSPPHPACQARSISSRHSSEEIWSLENDNDIRMLLDGSCLSTSGSHRPVTAGSVTTSGVRSDITNTLKLPARPHNFPQRPEKASSATRQINTRIPCGTAKREDLRRENDGAIIGDHSSLRQPNTRDKASRSSRQNLADTVQLWREMLLRAHGLGQAVESFADQPYETTGMGRRTPAG